MPEDKQHGDLKLGLLIRDVSFKRWFFIQIKRWYLFQRETTIYSEIVRSHMQINPQFMEYYDIMSVRVNTL